MRHHFTDRLLSEDYFVVSLVRELALKPLAVAYTIAPFLTLLLTSFWPGASELLLYRAIEPGRIRIRWTWESTFWLELWNETDPHPFLIEIPFITEASGFKFPHVVDNNDPNFERMAGSYNIFYTFY